MEDLPVWDLYAIRYATRDAQRRNHFMGGDPHEGAMPMDYFVWVAVCGDRVVVIDIGFNAEVAAQRSRTWLRCPIDTLKNLGVDPARVGDVVITHLHYDHAGNFGLLPAARFHLQEAEMQFATGPYMRYSRLSHSFEVEDVCAVVRLNFAQRVQFHRGDGEVAPGIQLHEAGGHSAGLQFVRVHTRRGWVVLASDVSHFYENLLRLHPFPTAFHVGRMLEGFDKLCAVAPGNDHIVPGHDPLVMRLYPAPSPELEGIAVRLDVAPQPFPPGTFPHSSH
ncbi:N-acyl homoserine lactonase family protein [Niveispirillum sp.]|uniref:N-acyl homoserine lactonase family protein n=1 Tax=Niveispirillum sp. TaxID=1917217 RepID=UPI001B714D82|nr:N-acyl homoserine lactonase family protein [Niveispirillum sp.]MBP7336547.1 N-acyl homoserine lactonase family protein [Niveispirillum sp.]